MSGKAKILLYGFDPDQEEVLDSRLETLGIPTTDKIQAHQGGMVLGDIIAGRPAGQGEDRLSREPVVLFHNISDRGLQTLIPFLKQVFGELGIPKPILAVVTPHSITWTFARLLEHLIAEKNRFTGGNADPEDSAETKSSGF